MSRFIFPVALCAIAFAGPSDSAAPPERADAKANAVVELVARIDREAAARFNPKALRIEYDSPIRLEWIKQVFGAAVGCKVLGNSGRTDCEGSNVAVDGVTIGNIDFRHTSSGSLLILKDFKEQCASVSQLRARYQLSGAENVCMDGVCFYAGTKRPWGRLSVGLLENPSSACADSIVFDTFGR
jgi:hypothetical protein